MKTYDFFPSWPKRGLVAIDSETHDPDLKTKGPGVRTNGYTVGYSVAFNDSYGFKRYYAFGHAEGNNATKADTVAYIKRELRTFKGELVFANALYDLDYMAQDGIHVPEGIPIRDVQIAEPLLDDNAYHYSLDRLAKQYVGVGKTEELMVSLYGAKFKNAMELTDGQIAGGYAEDDAALLLDIYPQQRAMIEKEGLLSLFELETSIVPMLLYMRRLGVRIDTKKTDRLSNEFFERSRKLLRELEEKTHVPFASGESTVWQNVELGRAFTHCGYAFPLTPTGKPSFRKEWLSGLAESGNELAKMIVDIRTLDKLNGTFLQSSLLGNHIDGRIHPTFNQVRNDEGGAVTGRFSCKNPNLQQIPSRDELAPLIRELFIPEESMKWGIYDYSQIEYRLLAHYAALKRAPGSMKVIKQYYDNPRTDYHELVQNMVRDMLGKEIKRKPIKSINFGLIYGMGVGKLSHTLHMEGDELTEFLDAYHKAIPFASYMKDAVTQKASRFGFIKTILGRKRRFNRWESTKWDESKQDGGMAYSEASERYGKFNVRRAETYKALNSLLQGSAADMMKKAMADVWKSGLCSIHGGPIFVHLTVHDELDFSFDPRTKEGREGFVELGKIIERAVPLELPVVVDGGYGDNWAEAEKDGAPSTF